MSDAVVDRALSIDRSLNLHAREIRDLKRRLRTAEVTLAAVLAYLVIRAALEVLL